MLFFPVVIRFVENTLLYSLDSNQLECVSILFYSFWVVIKAFLCIFLFNCTWRCNGLRKVIKIRMRNITARFPKSKAYVSKNIMPITKSVFMKKLPLTICKALESVEAKLSLLNEEKGLIDTHLADQYKKLEARGPSWITYFFFGKGVRMRTVFADTSFFLDPLDFLAFG